MFGSALFHKINANYLRMNGCIDVYEENGNVVFLIEGVIDALLGFEVVCTVEEEDHVFFPTWMVAIWEAIFLLDGALAQVRRLFLARQFDLIRKQFHFKMETFL